MKRGKIGEKRPDSIFPAKNVKVIFDIFHQSGFDIFLKHEIEFNNQVESMTKMGKAIFSNIALMVLGLLNSRNTEYTTSHK